MKFIGKGNVAIRYSFLRLVVYMNTVINVVNSYKTSLRHYIAGLHMLMSEALQKKATFVYAGCFARVNWPVTTPHAPHPRGEERHTYLNGLRCLLPTHEHAKVPLVHRQSR